MNFLEGHTLVVWFVDASPLVKVLQKSVQCTAGDDITGRMEVFAQEFCFIRAERKQERVDVLDDFVIVRSASTGNQLFGRLIDVQNCLSRLDNAFSVRAYNLFVLLYRHF